MRVQGRSRRSQGYEILSLRYVARGPAAQGRGVCFAHPGFRFAQSGMNPRPTASLAAQARPRKRDRATIGRPWRDWGADESLSLFLDAVRRGDPTPGGNARVSLFLLCRGDAIRKPGLDAGAI